MNFVNIENKKGRENSQMIKKLFLLSTSEDHNGQNAKLLILLSSNIIITLELKNEVGQIE